jgi:hypothetical protein
MTAAKTVPATPIHATFTPVLIASVLAIVCLWPDRLHLSRAAGFYALNVISLLISKTAPKYTRRAVRPISSFRGVMQKPPQYFLSTG